MEYFKQFFKNILLWNSWSYFEIISQECSLGDPFQKLFVKFLSIHKHGSGEWGLLALMFSESDKNGYGPLKNSDERSRAILALSDFSKFCAKAD